MSGKILEGEKAVGTLSEYLKIGGNSRGGGMERIKTSGKRFI